jgi:hypothetical protein
VPVNPKNRIVYLKVFSPGLCIVIVLILEFILGGMATLQANSARPLVTIYLAIILGLAALSSWAI